VVIKKANDEDNAIDVLEKINEINRIKNELIGNLQTQFPDIFNVLLKELMRVDDLNKSNKFVENILKSGEGL